MAKIRFNRAPVFWKAYQFYLQTEQFVLVSLSAQTFHSKQLSLVYWQVFYKDTLYELSLLQIS